MVPPRALPPIFKIALSFLLLLVYRTWMLSKRKTVEIRLWEFKWDPPCSVLRLYLHVGVPHGETASQRRRANQHLDHSAMHAPSTKRRTRRN